MSNNIVRITSSAAKKFRQIMKEYSCDTMRVSLKSGGCSGFEYFISPTRDPPDKLDEMVLLPLEGLKIQVCGKSLMYLMGVEIGWKKSIMGETFVFDNPNAGAQCGCGSSFDIKKSNY